MNIFLILFYDIRNGAFIDFYLKITKTYLRILGCFCLKYKIKKT